MLRTINELTFADVKDFLGYLDDQEYLFSKYDGGDWNGSPWMEVSDRNDTFKQIRVGDRAENDRIEMVFDDASDNVKLCYLTAKESQKPVWLGDMLFPREHKYTEFDMNSNLAETLRPEIFQDIINCMEYQGFMRKL